MPHPPPQPPMGYAPTYYGHHGRVPSPFFDASMRSSITKPPPAARGSLPPHLAHSGNTRLFSPTAHNSLPEPPESLSGSSTASASYSHTGSFREHGWPQRGSIPNNDGRYSPDPFTTSSQAECGMTINDRMEGRQFERRSEKPRSPTGASSSPRGSAARGVEATIFTYSREEEAPTSEPKDHVAWVLVCLSCIAPFVSIGVALYTFVALAIILFLTPIRLVQSKTSLRDQTSRALSPMLNLQLRMICSHDSIADNTRPCGAYNVPILVVVHLLSPFVSIGVAFSSWVAASFWIFATMMGNPDGTERKDDGKAAVLGVRNWWERWLARAIR